MIGAAVLAGVLSGPLLAVEPTAQEPIVDWLPVTVPAATVAPTLAPEPQIILEPALVAPAPPQRVVKQQPKVRVKVEPKMQAPGRKAPPVSRASVTGVATWYCNVGPPFPSRCTSGYGPSGAYAAAGPELRAALGHWRGKVVYVNGVRVTLIDWCGCGGDHIIDVYHDTWVRIPHPSHATITW